MTKTGECVYPTILSLAPDLLKMILVRVVESFHHARQTGDAGAIIVMADPVMVMGSPFFATRRWITCSLLNLTYITNSVYKTIDAAILKSPANSIFSFVFILSLASATFMFLRFLDMNKKDTQICLSITQ